MDLISVILPVYNVSGYLRRCIDSILKQVYNPIELILIDDGSTDESGAICDEYAKKDSRVSVIHQKNAGSSAARNAGLDAASGKYIGFVDGDDYIEADMYKILYNACISMGTDIAQIGRAEEDEAGRPMRPICLPPQKPCVIKSKDFLRELLLHKGDCSFCTKLFDGALFENARFPKDRLNEDFYLLLHMLTKTNGIVSLPYIGYHVTYRENSNSHRADKNEFSRVFADSVDHADLAAELVHKHFSGLTSISMRFCLFQRLEYLLHIPIRQMNAENAQYIHCMRYIRKHWLTGMFNPYLTLKNKLYITLFALSPVTLKKVHRKWKSFKN